MNKVIHLRDKQARIQQNNEAFRAVELLKQLVRKLIRDGFTITQMSFDRKGLLKVTIHHCKHCKTLNGAMYRTENTGTGKQYTWQKMVDGCRVEWIVNE